MRSQFASRSGEGVINDEFERRKPHLRHVGSPGAGSFFCDRARYDQGFQS